MNLGTVDMPIRSIRIVKTKEDREKALFVRWLGYKKYPSFSEPKEDVFDTKANCTLLLAEDDHGAPIGTMRILDARSGCIELESFKSLSEVMPHAKFTHRSFAEATRFSIPHSECSREAKLLIWKAFWLFCQTRSIEWMVIWTRPSAARDYLGLHFSDAGVAGVFTHPDLGMIVHRTFYAHTLSLPEIWRASKHPLTDVFLGIEHRCIDLS